jgi:hypothetical protein
MRVVQKSFGFSGLLQVLKDADRLSLVRAVYAGAMKGVIATMLGGNPCAKRYS